MMASGKTAALVVVSLMVAASASAQPLLGGRGGPYGPGARGAYAVRNPYAQELNVLALRNPAKHDACMTQANQRGLFRDRRWRFMIDCMRT
jgi:hypothetical protein